MILLKIAAEFTVAYFIWFGRWEFLKEQAEETTSTKHVGLPVICESNLTAETHKIPLCKFHKELAERKDRSTYNNRWTYMIHNHCLRELGDCLVTTVGASTFIFRELNCKANIGLDSITDKQRLLLFWLFTPFSKLQAELSNPE